MTYGIGIFEILLIFLVLLLFFKPAEIYSLFRRMGTMYRKIKKAEDDLRKDLDDMIDEEVENDDRKQ